MISHSSRPSRAQPVAGYSKDSQGNSQRQGRQSAESRPAQTANYAMPWWKSLLKNTSITIGCNNVFGQILRRPTVLSAAAGPAILASSTMPPDASFTLA